MEALKLTNCGNYFLEQHNWPLEKREKHHLVYDYAFYGRNILNLIRNEMDFLPTSKLSQLEKVVGDYEDALSFLHESQFIETVEITNKKQARKKLKQEYENHPLKRLHRVIIELNYQCQFKCQHCFQGSMKRNKGLETEKIKELLDDFSLLGIEDVMFYGGEATLRKDLFDILEYSRERIPGLSLATNGFWKNPKEMAKRLKDLDLTELHFTSYGYREEADKFTRKKGSYEMLEASLKQAKKQELDYTVTGWLPKDTPYRKRFINRLLWFNGPGPEAFSSLEEKEKILAKHKLLNYFPRILGNALTMDQDKNEVDLESIINKVKGGCSVFHKPYFFVVRPTGQVSSCFFTISGNEFGNVKEDSLFTILNNIQNTTIYKHHSEKKLDTFLPLIDRNLFRFFDSSHPECEVFAVLNSIVTIKEQLIEEGWEEEAAIKEANIITAKNLGFLKKNESAKTN